jgi:hypothetical protein
MYAVRTGRIKASPSAGPTTTVLGPVPHRARGGSGRRDLGDGTASSCTADALDTALTGGGLVTFNCGPGVVTIDISPGAGGSGTKTIGADTTVDGAGAISISGGHSVPAFRVMQGVAFTVQNLTIADGNGGGISNRGGNSDGDCNPFPGGACALRTSKRASSATAADHAVTIAEILMAVNSALGGCPAD